MATRDLLIVAAVLMAASTNAQTKPCPPPVFRVVGGTTVTTECDSGVPPTGLPTLGAHSLVYKVYSTRATSLSTPSLATQSSGSTLLVSVGRGIIDSEVLPADTVANTYVQLGSSRAYTLWPSSGTALYVAAPAVGGDGFVITVPNDQTPTDEVTVAAVEVMDRATLVDWKWNQVASGSPLTSLAVVTTGPATLVAYWWGDADGTVAETAVPGDGFTRVDALLSKGTLVQAAVAVREAQAAGSYSVTWTATPTQGAQLYLIAVQ